MDDHALPVGEKIRTLRKARGLTLEQLAQAAALSVVSLSQTERGLLPPSLAVLFAIARALDVPVSFFLHRTVADAPSGPTEPAGDAAPELTFRRVLVPDAGPELDAMRIVVPPLYATAAEVHEGEEFIYVIRGTLRCTIDGTVYDLQAGDSMQYPSRRPHAMENPAVTAAEVLSVQTRHRLRDAEIGRLIAEAGGS